MKQLTYIKAKQLIWEEKVEPQIILSDDALVRPFIVARCDLDAAFLFRNAYKYVSVGRLFGQLDKKIGKIVRPDLFRWTIPFWSRMCS